MAYLNNIPQANDRIKDSQLDILNNFIAIDGFVNVDHVEFNVANVGKHNQVTLPEQAAAPVPATLANEMQLYSKQGPLTAVSELFVRREGGGVENNMTASILSTNPAIGSFSNGWTYLPSGILMKWGYVVSGSAGLQTFNMITGANVPNFTAIFGATVTTFSGVAGDTDTFVRLVGLGIGPPNTITVYGSQRTAVAADTPIFTYLAIGR